MIQEYKHPFILTTPDKPCMIHEDFIPALDMICQYLKISECSLHINSSFRKDTNVSGAIVTPAIHSNHLIGCAIDANVIDKSGKLWSSEELKNPLNEVLMFINLVRRSPLLRWGGDFQTRDTIHFDNGLNIHDPKRWTEIFNELHPAIV